LRWPSLCLNMFELSSLPVLEVRAMTDAQPGSPRLRYPCTHSCERPTVAKVQHWRTSPYPFSASPHNEDLSCSCWDLEPPPGGDLHRLAWAGGGGRPGLLPPRGHAEARPAKPSPIWRGPSPETDAAICAGVRPGLAALRILPLGSGAAFAQPACLGPRTGRCMKAPQSIAQHEAQPATA